jgi:hypothetical protein
MPSKSSLAFIMIFIITSTFAVIHQTRADADQLILPSSHVTIEAFDSTISYFETKLTDVPSGYDVTNRTYPGWCIDQSAEMERSPTTHSVLLYSSLSPPGGLVDMEWDKVNYVLNHKQGGPQDVQQAIWDFINMNGGYSAETDLAQAMVAEAEASGTGFIPEDTQVMMIVSFLPALFYYIGFSLLFSSMYRGRRDDSGGGALIGIGFMIFSYVINLFILYLSRLREYYADRHSVSVVDGGAQKLSFGLAKIVNTTRKINATRKAQKEKPNSSAFKALFIADPDRASVDSAELVAIGVQSEQNIIQEITSRKLTFADRLLEAFSTHPNIVKRLRALQELN